MKNLIILLIFASFTYLNAQVTNLTNLTTEGDVIVGDDLTVVGGVATGEDLEVTGNIYATGNIEATLDLVVESDIVLAATIAGQDTFTTTAEADTIEILGALDTDLYFVNGVGGSVDQQDVLQVEAKDDTLIVHRLENGASALVYNWFRVQNE